MTEDKFWEIIAESRFGHGGSLDKQKAKLETILARLSIPDVIAFDRIFTQLRFKAYDWNLWDAAYIINAGCSDDGFEYFRCGLIGAGREKYEKALLDPESLGDWAVAEETEFELLMYVPNKVYKKLTCKNEFIKHADLEFPPISGDDWSEDGDDLEKRFPKLWAKFGG
jgi:hypothetical protein